MFSFRNNVVLTCCFLSLFSFLFPSKSTVVVEQHIKKISSTIPGNIGVAAWHIEKDQRIEVNGDQRYPMASTYKVPIALCCLSLS